METGSIYKKIAERKKRRGVLGFENIGPGALGVGIAVVMVAFMVLFLARFDASINASGNTTADLGLSNASTIVERGIAGLAEFNNWWSILVLALVFTIVIVIIVAVMGRVGSSQNVGRGGGAF